MLSKILLSKPNVQRSLDDFAAEFNQINQNQEQFDKIVDSYYQSTKDIDFLKNKFEDDFQTAKQLSEKIDSKDALNGQYKGTPPSNTLCHLKQLIESITNAKIFEEFKINNFSSDLLFEFRGQKIVVELDGPFHFTHESNYSSKSKIRNFVLEQSVDKLILIRSDVFESLMQLKTDKSILSHFLLHEREWKRLVIS